MKEEESLKTSDLVMGVGTLPGKTEAAFPLSFVIGAAMQFYVEKYGKPDATWTKARGVLS